MDSNTKAILEAIKMQNKEYNCKHKWITIKTSLVTFKGLFGNHEKEVYTLRCKQCGDIKQRIIYYD